jgi:formamidopyrimidine-DNA glycosylase
MPEPMPELPDILLYLHALEPRVVGQRMNRIRLASPFLLRSIDPPLSAVEGGTVVALHLTCPQNPLHG